MILKAYQYRIYPDSEAVLQIAQHFGAARFVYNTALELRNRYYQQFGKGISKRAVQDQFVALKSTAEFAWLNQIYSQTILSALEHVHSAYLNFFKGKAKFPRFKSKKSSWQSYQMPQHVKVDFDNGQVQLPKIGWVKAKLHRRFEGEIKTCTLKQLPSGYYRLTVLVETAEELPTKPALKEESTQGIDLGLSHFVILDNGQKTKNPKFLQRGLQRLGIVQKQFSRRQKGSKSHKEQKQKVAKQHLAVTNKRNNFLHQQSTTLVRDNQAETLAIEDLHVKGMIRNKKLARHIADVSWGRFVQMLGYKVDWYGKNLIRCNRFAPSSKQCECGHVHHGLTLKDRIWTCPACQQTWDRDVLAANNIKRFALAEAFGKMGESPVFA